MTHRTHATRTFGTKILLIAVALLLCATQGFAVFGVWRRHARRWAVVGTSVAVSSAGERVRRGQAIGGRPAIRGRRDRGGPVRGRSVAGLRGSRQGRGSRRRETGAGGGRARPEDAAAKARGARVPLQAGADHRKRVQRGEDEDPRPAHAVGAEERRFHDTVFPKLLKYALPAILLAGALFPFAARDRPPRPRTLRRRTASSCSCRSAKTSRSTRPRKRSGW